MHKADIQQRLGKVVDTIGFSGVAQLYYQDELIYETVAGYRHKSEKLPITINTRFGIASGTKFFTALGIMRLVEEGKCQLDDHAFSHIKTPFLNYNQSVTIRHLLSHTSGIPDYFDESQLDDESNLFLDLPWYALEKPSDYIPLMPDLPMEFEPGTKFKYNNSGYVLLAIIIERLTGDYHDWIKQEIFDKAKMEYSGAYRFDQLPFNTALGYILLPDGSYKTNQYHLPIIAGGDGGLYTTVTDMALFWQALLTGNIIKQETLNEMATLEYQSDTILYGLGLWLEKVQDVYRLILSGEDAGVSFKSSYNPKKQSIFTVISNTHDGTWPLVDAIETVINNL
ncbi:MAG: serine hydrolase domain-containing protein [Candidatus Izemoplasma sp.]|nr:serine hydrolase domain-containing protein [Candidatus Izemoplasma sp.]